MTPKAPAEKKTTPKAANSKAKNTPKNSKVAKPETSTASTTKPQEKKPRISKKKKEEMAKEQENKIEERKKNLIGEWDDEEDGEIFYIHLLFIKIKGRIRGDQNSFRNYLTFKAVNYWILGEAEVEEKKNNKQNIVGSDVDNDSDADSEQEAYFQVIYIDMGQHQYIS